MSFFLDKIARLRCPWNRKPLGEDDFYRLCKQHKVGVTEMPLRVSGFYYCVLGGHYIAIDSRLTGHQRLMVMFHEFAHYLMHVPDRNATAEFHGIGKKTRKEAEADMFALCALIPRTWIEDRTVQEIIEEEGLPARLVRERLALYERHGI
jgi:Zn-dependent peptidase ImmA (M78 family)